MASYGAERHRGVLKPPLLYEKSDPLAAVTFLKCSPAVGAHRWRAWLNHSAGYSPLHCRGWRGAAQKNIYIWGEILVQNPSFVLEKEPHPAGVKLFVRAPSRGQPLASMAEPLPLGTAIAWEAQKNNQTQGLV